MKNIIRRKRRKANPVKLGEHQCKEQSNVNIGYISAFSKCETGDCSTSIGHMAGRSYDSNFQNIATGFKSLHNLTTGNNNMEELKFKFRLKLNVDTFGKHSKGDEEDFYMNFLDNQSGLCRFPIGKQWDVISYEIIYDNLKEQVINAVSGVDNVRNEIHKVIGYDLQREDDNAPLELNLNSDFTIENGTVYIAEEDDTLELAWYSFEISSYGALAPKEFYAEKDGLMFVMCYNEEKGPDGAVILVFDIKNRKYDVKL